MSEENVELARRLYPGSMDLAATFTDPATLEAVRAAFEPMVQRDFDTVADPRYQMMLGGPGEELSVFTGMDGFIGAFRGWLSEWDRWLVTPTDFVDVDESRVLVLAEISGRSKAQQIDMAIQGGNLLTFREGKLARLELFFRRADALKAAGMSE
jgi:hypothetical protein